MRASLTRPISLRPTLFDVCLGKLMVNIKPYKLLLLPGLMAMSGCVSNGQTLSVPTNSAVSIFPTTPAIILTPKPNPLPLSLTDKNSSVLAQAILHIPSIAQSLAVAQISQSQVYVSQSEKALKVQATGSTGINSESSNSARGAMIVGVTGEKLLYDNGQADKAIFLSQLAAQTATLDAQIFIDQTLQKIIDAYVSRATASHIVETIDYYLNMFNKRENLVKRAVQAGVLSNLDYLELQALKNDVVSEKVQAELRFKSSDRLLRISFADYYDIAMGELDDAYTVMEAPTFSTDQTFPQQILKLKTDQLRTQIDIQQVLKKPVIKWQASISSPKSSSADSTIFAGLTIGMPLRDGGASVARTQALQIELDAITLETDMFQQKARLAEQSWNDFLVYQQQQNVLLLERKNISVKRTRELELRIKTGRSDITLLAKEFLTTANTEIALSQLEYEYVSQLLATTTVTGQTCELIDLCQALSKGIEP